MFILHSLVLAYIYHISTKNWGYNAQFVCFEINPTPCKIKYPLGGTLLSHVIVYSVFLSNLYSTMSLSINFAVSNMLVINKYVWMGRQLWNFNNIVSIMNWANAMILVKSLLLEIQPEPQSSTNTQPQSPSIIHAQHRFKGNYQHIYLTRIPPSIQASRSITPPTAVCFKPATEKPFTRSPPRCSSYKPVKPPPLSTYTLCLLNIKPVDLPQNRKKKKACHTSLRWLSRVNRKTSTYLYWNYGYLSRDNSWTR